MRKDADGNLIKKKISSDLVSVCVEDFCGYTNPGHFPISFWADYIPSLKITRFGGAWWNVPDLHTNTEPSENTLFAWVKKYLNGAY